MIIDCAVMPFELAEANGGSRDALDVAEELYRRHRSAVPRGESPYRLTRSEFFDVSPAAVAKRVFVESPVDAAVYQSLVLRGVYRTGPVPVAGGARLRQAYGDQLVLFGGTSIIHAEQAALDIQAQREEFGIVGVALYPQRLLNAESSRAAGFDSADLEIVLAHAQSIGIGHVSIYRSALLGMGDPSGAGLQALSHAVSAFPDLTFQIIQGDGFGLGCSALLAARHRNVYVNLEGVFSWIVARPRMFFEAFARLAVEAGYEKLLFASGCGLAHPAPLIEAFQTAQLPADLQVGYGLPALDQDAKKAVLGGNAERILDL
jgi:uncharacterized protein